MSATPPIEHRAECVDATCGGCVDDVAVRAEASAESRRIDAVYEERDRCVALASRLAAALGMDAWIGRHVGEDWDDEWRTVVFVQLPTGQVSWHVHDREMLLFAHLPRRDDRPWDGHSTEEKYERCAALVAKRRSYGRFSTIDELAREEDRLYAIEELARELSERYEACLTGALFRGRPYRGPPALTPARWLRLRRLLARESVDEIDEGERAIGGAIVGVREETLASRVRRIHEAVVVGLQDYDCTKPLDPALGPYTRPTGEAGLDAALAELLAIAEETSR